MAQLFVRLAGAFHKHAGSGFSQSGEDLDLPHWRGAELGDLDTFPDVWAAVSEAEYHDWIIGVNHPLYRQGGPAALDLLHPDPVVREHSRGLAGAAAQSARHIGARYIIFTLQWPAQVDAWTDEQSLFEAHRRIFEALANLQEKESISCVLRLMGPNPYAADGELYARLFGEYSGLSLCLDTAELGHLCRAFQRDPLNLTRQWAPWTRYVHVRSTVWDSEGHERTDMPVDGTHVVDRWPWVTPTADVTRLIVEAQPRCTVVLAHNAAAASGQELDSCYTWARTIVAKPASLG